MLILFRFILLFFVGILFTLVSLLGIVFLCILLLVFYCLYRFIWLFSATASIKRSKNRFEKRKTMLLLSAKKKRSDYSIDADRHDILELIQQINQHLQLHQQLLDIQLVDELHYLLDRCQQNLNFEKTLHIHAIVTKTDRILLNTAISEIVNDITILD